MNGTSNSSRYCHVHLPEHRRTAERTAARSSLGVRDRQALELECAAAALDAEEKLAAAQHVEERRGLRRLIGCV
jgi:hypothetical protein